MPVVMDLTHPQALYFDIYATLIDWEAGVYPQLLALARRSASSDLHDDTPATKSNLLHLYETHQWKLWAEDPTCPWPQILSRVYNFIATTVNAPVNQEAADAFGASVGSWPAFVDTVPAMQVLAKHYKIFVLSNVDNASFARTNAGPLQGKIPWDGIYTAEMIGSYKPDPRNYDFVAEEVEKGWGIPKERLRLVAQSLDGDHVMSKKLGFMPGVWISREGSVMGGKKEELEAKGEVELGAVFGSLGEMATAVEAAFAGKGKAA